MPKFVIQEHNASHLHYDFRLEIDGALKSWAVPKNLPEKSRVKRLAIQVDDHPADYINFEGIIPEGSYGAGTVRIYDDGEYKLNFRSEKKIEFYLYGKIFSGLYKIYNIGNDQWLIEKV